MPITKSIQQQFQTLLQEFLARLPRFSHISATLFDLHWLPIRYRFTFKICILTYQAYHRTAPSYLCDLIVPYVNTRSLRYNNKCLIKPCKPRLRTYGQRCFKQAGPQEWNKLPIHIRKISSLSNFKTQLKTFISVSISEQLVPKCILVNVPSVLSYLHFTFIYLLL